MIAYAPACTAGWLTIKEVSDRLGLSPALMRLWESRYGWPCPRRTPAGQRRFSPADVQEIREVLVLIRSGRAISTLIRAGQPCLPTVTESRAPLAESNLAELPLPQRPLAKALRDELVDALRRRDGCSALRLIHQAPRDCSPPDRGRAAWLPVLILLTAWEEAGQPLADAASLRAHIIAQGGPEQYTVASSTVQRTDRAA